MIPFQLGVDPDAMAAAIDLDALAVEVSARIDTAAIAAQAASLVPPSGPELWHANSGDASERVPSLTISPTTKAVVFSLPIPDLQLGDLLVVFAEAQATNDHTYNVMYGTQLLLAAAPGSAAGTELSEATTLNISPNMHHFAKTQVGTLTVARIDRTHVNLAAWASASRAVGGDTLTIDQDYGRLAVIRLRST